MKYWTAGLLLLGLLLACEETLQSTCCPSERYKPCCPYDDGVCCGGGYASSCCPSGWECGVLNGENTCLQGALNTTRLPNYVHSSFDFPPKEHSQCRNYNQDPVGPHQCEVCCRSTYVCCKNRCIMKSRKTPCTPGELSRSYPVSEERLDAAFQWLLCTEGFSVRGHCPTTASGLTIGAGVDLGQQKSHGDLQKVGTPHCLRPQLHPFYGRMCTDECFNPAKSTAVKLCLTATDAAVLSKGFLADALKKILPYVPNVDSNTLSSLASIRHWAGALGQSCQSQFTSAYKLCVPNSNGTLENLLWSAINTGQPANVTSSVVESAVSATLDQYKELNYGTGKSRFTKELAHIQGNMPCTLSINSTVCNRQICTTCDEDLDLLI